MEKMEHTKGPWHYQEESDAYTHIIRGAKGEFIGSASQGSKNNEEANARLMAAAPDLLETLKDQRQLMVGYKSRLDCDGAYVAARQVADRIEMVDAVIAKAQPKSSRQEDRV